VAVDGTGRVHISDYYHDALQLFGADIGAQYPYGYQSQILGIDPLDGPCGIATDADGNVYVNDYHRSVIKYVGATGTVIAGAPLDASRPTAVAVDQIEELLYVDDGDHIAVLDFFGGLEAEIGASTLEDGYGVAVSRYPGTEGFLYVADAASETLKVYDPATEPVNPIATIDGSQTPLGRFVSLRDAAVAVDDVSGEIYVTDDLEPLTSDHPEAVVYVFDSAGAYEGRLKNSVLYGQPVGLAVDNSQTLQQGRVYVTTGNSEKGGLYAYPPHAATSAAVPLPDSAPGGGADPALGLSSAGATPALALASANVLVPTAAEAIPAPSGSVARRGRGRGPKHRHGRRKARQRSRTSR
jgi:hypothetical protein